MHDMDRTQAEYWGEVDTLETDEYGFMGEDEFYSGETEGLFSEADEMELAAELLEITDEQELDQFLGKLLKRAARTVGKAITSPVGRSIGGMLKGVAKTALPMVGGALGNLVLPGVGGAIGGQLASAAGSMFGLELEGMSAEDQEFEVARRVVRLAGEAVRQAAAAPGGPPKAIAQKALQAAAQQHAPGLVGGRPALVGANGAGMAGGMQPGPGQGNVDWFSGRSSGRWIRRGNRIVIYGA